MYLHYTVQGVSITGLGTFTFSKRKIDVGNNKAIFVRRPVFALSERFIQTHSLQCIKQRTSGAYLYTIYLIHDAGSERSYVCMNLRPHAYVYVYM